MKKYTKCTISLLLVLSLLLAMLPGLWITADSIQASDDMASSETNVARIDQLQLDTDSQLLARVDKRSFIERKHIKRLEEEEDLSSYAFLNEDGSRTVYYMNEPVKYLDDDGIQYEKNLDMQKTARGYETTRNDILLSVPNDPSDGIRLEHLDTSVALIPQNGELKNQPVLEDNSVTYPDFYGEGVSLRYTPTLSGVKEDILLREYTGLNQFVFLLKTEGMRLYQSENGFYLSESKTAAQRIDLGDVVAFDATGRFSLGSMTVETIKEGEEYRLTLTVDTAFLTAETTTYPVVIDPTLTVDYDTYGANAIEDTSLFSGRPTVNGDWLYLHAGYYDDTYKVARTLVRLPGLLRSSAYCSTNSFTISKVEFHIREASGTAGSVVPLYANGGNSNWTESGATWNSAGVILGSTYAAASPSYGNDTVYDITQLVKAWQDGIYSGNAGFILRNSDETNSDKTFHSAECSTTSNRPYAVVTYSINETIGGTGGGINFSSAVDLNLGYAKSLSTVSANELRYFQFTPAVSDTYIIQSSNSSGDPKMWIYDQNYVQLGTDDDSGAGLDFRRSQVLLANKTYYIAAGHFGSQTGSYCITVLRPVTEADVGHGFYHIQNRGSALYLDIHGPTEQKYLHQWTMHSGEQEKWLLQQQSDGYWTIRSQYRDNLYVGVANSNTGENNVQLFSSITDQTRWNLYIAYDSTYILEPKYALGKVMYAPNSTSGTELRLGGMGDGGSLAKWMLSPYHYSGLTFSAFDIGDSAEDEVAIVESYFKGLGYTDIGTYKNTEGIILPRLIKDVSRFSDVVYVNGHGGKKANLYVKDASETTIGWLCADSTIDTGDTLEKIEIGAEWKSGSTTISESCWNNRTKWVIFAQCSQFNMGSEGDGEHWNGMNSAGMWARTMLGNGNRLHGFLGYYDSAPPGDEHVSRLENFLNYAQHMTIVDAWKEAHDTILLGNTNWAVMYHESNVNDRLTSFTTSTSPGSQHTIYIERRETPSTSSATSTINLVTSGDYPVFVDKTEGKSVESLYAELNNKLSVQENDSLLINENDCIVYKKHSNSEKGTNLGIEISDVKAVEMAVQQLNQLDLLPADEYRTTVSYVRRYRHDTTGESFSSPETIECTVSFYRTYNGIDVISNQEDGIVVSFDKSGLTGLRYKWRDIQIVEACQQLSSSSVSQEEAKSMYRTVIGLDDAQTRERTNNTEETSINVAYLQVGNEVRTVWVCSPNGHYGSHLFVDRNTGEMISV